MKLWKSFKIGSDEYRFISNLTIDDYDFVKKYLLNNKLPTYLLEDFLEYYTKDHLITLVHNVTANTILGSYKDGSIPEEAVVYGEFVPRSTTKIIGNSDDVKFFLVDGINEDLTFIDGDEI